MPHCCIQAYIKKILFAYLHHKDKLEGMQSNKNYSYANFNGSGNESNVTILENFKS